MRGQPNLSAHSPIPLPSHPCRCSQPITYLLEIHMPCFSQTQLQNGPALHDLPLPAQMLPYSGGELVSQCPATPFCLALPTSSSSLSSILFSSRPSGNQAAHGVPSPVDLPTCPALQTIHYVLHPIRGHKPTIMSSGKQHTLCLTHQCALPCRSSASSCSPSTTTPTVVTTSSWWSPWGTASRAASSTWAAAPPWGTACSWGATMGTSMSCSTAEATPACAW